MTVSNAAIKSISRKAIKANFLGSVFCAVLLLSVAFINYNISSVFYTIAGQIGYFIVSCILGFSLFLPLFMGAFRYFWRMVCGVNDNPITIFYYFSNITTYKKVIRLIFLLFIRILVVYLIFLIPVFIFKIITSTWIYDVLDMPIPIWTANLSYIGNILKFVAFVATLFSAFKFYLAPFLFVCDESLHIDEIIHLSNVISKRSMLDFIFFISSFVSWFLLSFLVVPLILTIPYFLTSLLIYCSYVIADFNDEISKIGVDDIPTFVAGA